jgi:hypothetical protein
LASKEIFKNPLMEPEIQRPNAAVQTKKSNGKNLDIIEKDFGRIKIIECR